MMDEEKDIKSAAKEEEEDDETNDAMSKPQPLMQPQGMYLVYYCRDENNIHLLLFLILVNSALKNCKKFLFHFLCISYGISIKLFWVVNHFLFLSILKSGSLCALIPCRLECPCIC